MPIPIPLLMAIEFLKHHDDDRIEHLLRLGVVGMPEPLTVEIESDFFKWPRIKNIWTHGGIDLPPRLQDLLIFKCFDMLLPSLEHSDIGNNYTPDATRWIETEFLDDEAKILLAELRRHVPLGWKDDGTHYSAFMPIPLPPAKGSAP